MAFDCKLGRQTYALGVLSMTAYPGLNSATKVPQSGPTWMSGFAAVLAHTFPLPRSAMSIQRARLSGYFKAGRRQSGLKPHVGPTVGIGRAFHETHRREWARSSLLRMTAPRQVECCNYCQPSALRRKQGSHRAAIFSVFNWGDDAGEFHDLPFINLINI